MGSTLLFGVGLASMIGTMQPPKRRAELIDRGARRDAAWIAGIVFILPFDAPLPKDSISAEKC